MAKRICIPVLFVVIIFIVAINVCCNPATIKTEKVEGVEWNVMVKNVVEFNDTVLGIVTDNKYSLADTTRMNTALKEIKHCGNLTIGWTIPSADGSIFLVAYENEPILSEKVTVTEINSIPSYGGNIQVAFKFPDAAKWESVTRESIGKRLAVFVNGRLMNAPQVNSEITSGNCSVLIPSEQIHDYLPNLDMEKLQLQ